MREEDEEEEPTDQHTDALLIGGGEEGGRGVFLVVWDREWLREVFRVEEEEEDASMVGRWRGGSLVILERRWFRRVVWKEGEEKRRRGGTDQPTHRRIDGVGRWEEGAVWWFGRVVRFGWRGWFGRVVWERGRGCAVGELIAFEQGVGE